MNFAYNLRKSIASEDFYFRPKLYSLHLYVIVIIYRSIPRLISLIVLISGFHDASYHNISKTSK